MKKNELGCCETMSPQKVNTAENTNTSSPAGCIPGNREGSNCLTIFFLCTSVFIREESGGEPTLD